MVRKACSIAEIARHRKSKAHRRGAETRRTAQVRISEQGDGAVPHDPPVIGTARKPLARRFLWVYNSPVRILMCDKQAVSGFPELHWRQYEHHFVQRRAVSAPARSPQKTTTTTIHEKKLRHEPITCLTAYDYATARLVDQAGIDMILVGDALAQVVLGYDNTLPVTMEGMLHHTRAGRGWCAPPW